MPITIGGGLSFCGRELKPEELELIGQITRDFSTLSLTELALHGLRVAGMAPAKRRPEEPGMLRLSASLARSRLASLVVAAAEETSSAFDPVG